MIALSVVQMAFGLLSGSLVGFSLGLVGGGGSILAVPLMVYLVGVADPHVAIGTSAIAVAANAAVNLANHARSGNVKWPCAAVFTVAGIGGAFCGSILGKMLDGQKLLLAFALLMLAVLGLCTGVLSGFFGIGGGFLIVPALMLATGMPILNAIGSSLVAVTAFGLTTATSYAFSGFVDWSLALLFVAGGIVGGLLGARLAKRLSNKRAALNNVFAGLIFGVSIYMIIRSSIAI